MLICSSQKCYVIFQMLCDFPDSGHLQTMWGLHYSIESSETGNSTDKLVEGSTKPPRFVVLEHGLSVCVQERVAFLPQTGFGSLNLSTAFICSQMENVEPAETKLSGRWEGWAQTHFGMKQSLSFWPTPLHKKKIQVDGIFLRTPWDGKGDPCRPRLLLWAQPVQSVQKPCLMSWNHCNLAQIFQLHLSW